MSKIISAKGVLYAVTDYDQDDREIFRPGSDVQFFPSRRKAREAVDVLNSATAPRRDHKRKLFTIRSIECRVTW
jgi:hypothetical protein